MRQKSGFAVRLYLYDWSICITRLQDKSLFMVGCMYVVCGSVVGVVCVRRSERSRGEPCFALLPAFAETSTGHSASVLRLV